MTKDNVSVCQAATKSSGSHFSPKAMDAVESAAEAGGADSEYIEGLAQARPLHTVPVKISRVMGGGGI